jgi:hypothetical protein
VAGAALAAVVAIAAVDAVRRDAGEQPPAATTELAGRAEVAEQLARLGARGQLVVHDGACGETALSLPKLARRRSDLACARLGTVSPDGSLVARCLGDETEIFDRGTSQLVRAVPGCAPAWRPDGTLTVSHERAVVHFYAACHAPNACIRTLIARSELERAARSHLTVPADPVRLRVLVDGIAWLSEARVAVLLSIRISGRLGGLGALSMIAFFENGRLSTARTYVRMAGGRLAASPRGSYVTQTPDVILRPDGSQVSLPPHLGIVQDFAWSPDEQLLALAGRYAIVVVDVASLERYDDTGGGLRSVTIPQPAARLAWR